MKKIYILSTMMLIVVAAILPQKSYAQTFYQSCSTGQCLLYTVTNSSEVSVEGWRCMVGDLVIPPSVTHDGITYSVTSIEQEAFSGDDLTSIIIPSSITSIGSGAFGSCISLTSINIPSSVTSIGSGAFSGCSSLTSIVIPSSVTSIEGYAFAGCSSLTSILIPSSVTSIGSHAFSNCSSLTSFNIPNSITSIKNGTFYDCSSLTSINIPSSVTSIASGAFSGCSSLTSVNIPNSVTSIGENTFYGCSSLTSINIPSSVTSIGNNAFSSCSSLTSITVDPSNHVYDSRGNCNAIISGNILLSGCQNTIIPNSVTSIEDNAFSGCSSLTSVNIPNSVTSIGENSFYGCSSLTSINIPSSVTSIGNNAFSSCSSLTSITVDPSNHVYDSRGNCNAIISGNILLSGCQNTIIPNSVTSIGGYAFLGCSSLTSINIPSSVTSIGSDAFSRCSSLTSINIPNSVTSIGGSAFLGCSSLTSINIPSSVTSIGSNAFSRCSSLTSINIPNSVTSIEYEAFYECSSLTAINIPSSVTSIGFFAFSRCSSLTSINIPSSVTSIGSGAFSGCSSLTSINIPSSVTSIGNYAFTNCSGLTSITVDPNNSVFDSRNSCNAIIRTSSNQLLSGCQNTIIPASVTSIFEGAFHGCVGSDTITCLATTPPVLEGCVCYIFDDMPDDFRVIIPCGTLPDYMAAWSDLPYLLESGSGSGYDTSITIACPDPCYTWNSVEYCTSGDYTQTFQTVHGCDSVVTLHLTITVGLNDYNGCDFKVYPNPTSNVVNIECIMKNEEWSGVELHLCDAYGRLLDVVETGRAPSLQTVRIDMLRYANGVYFVKAVADGKTIAVRKVVKQ